MSIQRSKPALPIPYGKQFITEDDVQAVAAVLRSEYLTQGPTISEFEQSFAKYIGCKFAVAVSNGTAALHLSMLALNVSQGDKVITTPISFSATSNCIRYVGGDVVFADIDPRTYLLDIKAVRELLEKSPRGTYKGIVPVDFGGLAVDLEDFRSLAEEFGLWIVEDACHAPGGYFIDSSGASCYCGDCKYADLGIFSFHPVKHIAAGEGGMITTNSKELYEKLLLLRTHGITRDASSFQNSIAVAGGDDSACNYPGWYMEMHELGYNYRLTDIQAALALSQLSKASERLEIRREIARYYTERLSETGLVTHYENTVSLSGHAYHLYVVQVAKRRELYEFLKSKGIFAQVHYVPIHLMPYYQHLGYHVGDMPKAEAYYSGCLSLPMYPSLTRDEQAYVCDMVLEFYR